VSNTFEATGKFQQRDLKLEAARKIRKLKRKQLAAVVA
jgi:hypothetical protein